MERTCKKCGETKLIEEFDKDKSKKLGRTYICKACRALYQRQYVLVNADEIKKYKHEYHIRNKTKIKKQHKKYHESHRVEHIERRRKWVAKNKERYKIITARAYEKHKDKILAYAHKYRKEHLKENCARVKKYYKNHRDRFIDEGKIYVRDMPDLYIIDLLNNNTGISRVLIKQYPELIEAKREQLKLTRLIKEQNENSNRP